MIANAIPDAFFSHVSSTKVPEIVAMFKAIHASERPLGQKIETVEKIAIFPFPACLGGSRGLGFFGNRSRVGWRGGRMDWARILAYVSGTVDQELLARIEYLAAQNRILKAQLKGG